MQGLWLQPFAGPSEIRGPAKSRSETHRKEIVEEIEVPPELIEQYMRDVPDFPKPGIVFKDITPLLQSPEGLRSSIELLAKATSQYEFDIVCGIESRGFIFGTALATMLGKGFVPIRKPGKLPWKTESESYELEYGTDTVEMHVDAVAPKQRVLIVDDLMATGGTAAAAVRLVHAAEGKVVACSFLVELGALRGREVLGGERIHSVIRY